MKITSKGQVTIPQAVREKAGLLPHTEVEFHIQGEDVVLRKASGRTARGERILKALRGAGTVQMTTDEIMELTRGE